MSRDAGEEGTTRRAILLLLGALLPLAGAAEEPPTPLETALRLAAAALDAGKVDDAGFQIGRALERDPRSLQAWELRARWAAARGDRAERTYCLHRHLRLAIAQGERRERIEEWQARLLEADPRAGDLQRIRARFTARFEALAKEYEKRGRPHAAIRVHQEILALDPERAESRTAIERISAAPDPSLAETAKPRDLLADVSKDWIARHDARHATWKTRAKLERENYTTHTDAGYEVLLRSAEAMEQMNAFYRLFFHYGTPERRRSVPRIDLHIFKDRDEYLALGQGPPVKWSGGHFTGGSVETYVGAGGMDEMTRTLFHEAAHQFVSLATNATGWLNEGLASFFEGCRLQANGTVLMNFPADHRLFPLATRMERGWMADANDGIDPADPSASNPEKAPTWRIVLENRYAWGPAWYAPTWGVVYFLYNFQDPADGRFLYRAAFREYIDKSGGRTGEGAVEIFEKTVLAHPARPTPGLGENAKPQELPRTVDALSAVWKDFSLALRDRQSGKNEEKRPWLDWARYALRRGQMEDAAEFFEKGLLATPEEPELLEEFAEHLAGAGKDKDRACKLVERALALRERADLVDPKAIEEREERLAKWDPHRRTLRRARGELWAALRTLVKAYEDAGQDLMVLDWSARLAHEMEMPGMRALFERTTRRTGRSLALWELAYDEKGLAGWSVAGGEVWHPRGEELVARFLPYASDLFDYQVAALDRAAPGDFSLEAEVLSQRGANVFCGFVFGKKSADAYHAIIFFPGVGMTAREGEGPPQGFLDLATFFSPGVFKVWRHNPVDPSRRAWHKLRLDVTGRIADLWFDDELVVSHEFATLDLLRGQFGLVTGRGEVRFRNVRYRARNPRDPSGAIERELRIEALQVPGRALAGSWLGQRPPWPRAKEWVQAPRASFEEKGPVPTLLVFWSLAQNGILPIDGWLNDLAARYASCGLEVIAVCETDVVSKVTQYLVDHPLPGSVMVDFLDRRKGGYGETFEAYEIGQRFHLPRLLLLDHEQKVVWEGDPGFPPGEAWKAGTPTYLDTPLEELVAGKRLRELFAWRKAWPDKGPPALHAGDLATVLPLLQEARTLPPRGEVARARAILGDLEGAAGAPAVAAEAFGRAGREPALGVLLAWAELLGVAPDAATKKELEAQLKGPASKAWERALARVRRVRSGTPDAAALEALAEELGTFPGAFPRDLAAAIRSALAQGGVEAARRHIEEAESMPTLWLARNHFGF